MLPEPEDPVSKYLKARKPATDDPVSAYLKARGTPDPDNHRDFHEEYRKGLLGGSMARENANEREAAEAEEPGYAEQALGGIASLARHIPGAEMLQAAAASGASRIPFMRGADGKISYREARTKIRDAEDSAPKWVRRYNSVVGSVPAMMAMPGGAMAQGARLGIAEGLLDSDADKDATARVHDATLKGALGGAMGKASEVGINLARAKLPTWMGGASSLGENALQRKASMKAADKVNYGQAKIEGDAAGATPQAVTDAFEHPTIKPFADLVRGSEAFAGANDATVLRETYKLLSKQQGGLERRLAEQGYDAAIDLQRKNITAAKTRLLQASQAAGVKPAMMMDVAPETFSVDPKITPGRETLDGPVQSGPLASHTTAPNDPTLRQALRDFPESSLPPKMQGPSGPAFQLRGQPDKVRPGVEIGAPGEFYDSSWRYEGPERYGFDLGSHANHMRASTSRPTPMRIQTAPAEPIPALMPSFPRAVATHAENAGDIGALREGADAARRQIRGSNVAGKKLDTSSPEAFRESVALMKPSRASAATEGALGRLDEMSGLTMNPLTGFGTLQSAVRANRLGPVLHQLDMQSRNQNPAFLRALMLALASQANP